MVSKPAKPQPLTPENSVTHLCGAKLSSRDGTCTRQVKAGSIRCHIHGGHIQKVQRAALDRRNELAARNKVAKRLKKQGGYDRIEDAVEELEKLAAEALMFKEICWERLQAIKGDWRYSTSAGEQLRSEAALYERAMDRCNKLLTDYVKLGIAERRVKISEIQAMMLVGVIQNVLGRLDLTRDQKRLAAQVVPEELRAIEAPQKEG